MSKKLTYNYIKSYIESYNYQLLSKKYINANEKLKLQCPEDHIFYMTYGNFSKGHRCSTCAKRNYGSYKKLNYQQVKKYIELYEYKLLSKEYKNNRAKLKLQCPEEHIFYMTYNNFKNGQRCPTCAKRNCGSYKRLTLNQIKKYIESYGYQLLSKEYKNAHQKLKLQCPRGHNYYTKFNSFQQGYRCPICYYNSTSSMPEREVQEYCKNIYNGKVLPNDRDTIVNPSTGWNLELDVYLPEISKAIEFNGTYWHSLPNNDDIKKQQCKQKNIDLLVVNEENWNSNKEMCLQIIKNFITKDNYLK